MNPVMYITFGAYLLGMIIVGAIFCKKSKTVDDYLIGGRGLGSWVTALSAQASDMSGWLLMGLPGAIYIAGAGDVWVAIGLLLGTLLNWLFIAPRLRIYTEKCNALTLSSFFENRFRDPSNMLRVVSAVVTLLFFTIYAASGLVATGKLFDSMFGMKYEYAVLLGTVVVLLYTALGGYLAVCWTDLFQGALMFFALLVVPVLAYYNLPDNVDAAKMTLNLFPDGFGVMAFVSIISCAVWGLGYCGQPHILVRFMSIKSVKLLPRTITIAMIWVTISLFAAVAVGLIARGLFIDLPKGENEKVFIMMINKYCWSGFAGLFLAAILAAIMSTIDSQLLVSSSTLTSDFYQRVFRRNASAKELVHVSRGFVILITVIACLLALFPFESIFNIVKFAWGGFGAAFGPVVIMALYSRRTTWQSALCGMLIGTVVMIVWYLLGWNKYMYEILPGFVANWVVIVILNRVFIQKDETILKEFDEMKAELNCSENVVKNKEYEL